MPGKVRDVGGSEQIRQFRLNFQDNVIDETNSFKRVLWSVDKCSRRWMTKQPNGTLRESDIFSLSVNGNKTTW